ncbi:MAG: helix-turn-helix domain-containing protein [Blautia sp.]|nr:helix-turn-helix domain-containing protein [Blautia sp.]
MPEMARLLGIKRSTVYYILNRDADAFEIVLIDGRRNIVKESFYSWYQSQDKYRIVKEMEQPVWIENEENSQIEVLRRITYDKDKSGKHIGNADHLTISEAALLAEVEKTTISKWIKEGYFQVVKSGNIVRIPRKSFENWLKNKKGESTWLPL